MVKPKIISVQRGFTLLEVLIAIVITAFGLLGLAATQSLSLKHSQNSVFRTTATILASQMADNIRVNRTAKADYIIADIETINQFTNCFQADANCSPADIAQFDLFVWKNDIKIMLPESSANIATKVGDANVFVITLNWKERTDKAEANNGLKESSLSLEVFP